MPAHALLRDSLPHLSAWHPVPAEAPVPPHMPYASIHGNSIRLHDGTPSGVAPFSYFQLLTPILISAPPAADEGDPLDEGNKADRFDCDGDRWEWSRERVAWSMPSDPGGDTARGTLAAVWATYGPLTFDA